MYQVREKLLDTFIDCPLKLVKTDRPIKKLIKELKEHGLYLRETVTGWIEHNKKIAEDKNDTEYLKYLNNIICPRKNKIKLKLRIRQKNEHRDDLCKILNICVESSKEMLINAWRKYIYDNKLQLTDIGKRGLIHWPDKNGGIIPIIEIHSKYFR